MLLISLILNPSGSNTSSLRAPGYFGADEWRTNAKAGDERRFLGHVWRFPMQTNVDPLIVLLQVNSGRTTAEMASALGVSEADVKQRIAAAEKDGLILGYHAVVDRQKAGYNGVTALIEVRITPERDGGFDRLARRIAQFDQVRDCFLMSGGYDLAVVVEGKDLLDVANFVTEKLSTIGGVISTATRFQLKAYKQGGFLAQGAPDEDRLPVSP